MAVSDPIADFLNRIKNGQKARFDKVDIPASRMKASLSRILKEEGYIKNFKLIKDDKQGIIRVQIKYGEHREGAITGIKRVSRPGCRVYVGHDEIPRVMNGMGIGIVSTSKGIMTDRQARKEGIGGELLCSIW
ncbi:30S ribosomal protein S8 [Syntrophobacter fumaroxidans]|uniref:Small ribosomal subunit protein uS8 n=1 Tax=Syntrophobacter fumaroxidans (strain DSM 10017 / MPOB) TaxID=335543 RepID=RS8_SYNFM|nr:30S ribosomal protein S8 [Syntrophobacter fumaroxidans]A0LIK4.1 RecName: Full=Small ribosomal subunit protein uS8; AltName: Full=30S ribosomal protein S8 [Syntrophobacter fumaroxidans MPOB]ABK17256.1 SSU ribosomal protein S8P [Syntrophobacter fumaroxidans MPOB]